MPQITMTWILYFYYCSLATIWFTSSTKYMVLTKTKHGGVQFLSFCNEEQVKHLVIGWVWNFHPFLWTQNEPMLSGASAHNSRGMFEVRALPGKGDAVVATRSVGPSSAILIEEAALVGPSSNNACIDCLSSEVSLHKACSGCRHVLCSQEHS